MSDATDATDVSDATDAIALAALGMDDLRNRRQELQAMDDAVSYVRRVAQGRADLARAELARRRSGANAADAGTGLTDDLRDVLADRLLAGPGRPPRPVEDFSEHARAAQLDRLCAEHGFGRLPELDADDVARLADVLDAFETDVSAERRRVFVELDGLTEELVRRYRDQTDHLQEPRDDLSVDGTPS